MDVLGDILSSMRLTGGVILHGRAAGDWCVSSQMGEADIAPFAPDIGAIIAYHYVRSGTLWAQVGNEPPIEAGPGSILLLTRNDPHRLFTAPDRPAIDSHDFIVGATEHGLADFVIEGDGPEAQFFCGFLSLEEGRHPLLDCLPPLLKVSDISEAREQWLESNLAFLSADQPSHEMVARIAELLFAQAVRDYLEQLPPEQGGWLAGLKDPVVTRALAVIHRRFAEELDVELLAREAGVSRTVLGERFAATLGEPPMRYCARWRMRQAAAMLREGKHNTANIAYAVGFNSEASFNRAFKREFGVPPGLWKRLNEEEAADGAALEESYSTLTSADGTSLACASAGKGPPLLVPGLWFHHVREDGDSPLWGHWLRAAARGHRQFRANARGLDGSCQWTFDKIVEDLVALADHAGSSPADILAFSNTAPAAIAFAVRHPERVRRLVIVGGYARGVQKREDAQAAAVRVAAVAMGRQMMERDPASFGRMLAALVIPNASPECEEWAAQRFGHPLFLVEEAQDCYGRIDVTDLLQKVAAPVLLIHNRGDRVSPFSEAELMAEKLPDARLVPLQSDNHILTAEEAGWPVARAALLDFLG